MFDVRFSSSLPPLGHGGKLVFLIWAWKFDRARICYDCVPVIFINQVVVVFPTFSGIAFVVCIVVSCDDIYVLFWDFKR